jgi:diphosphomevalonate decarboxylase
MGQGKWAAEAPSNIALIKYMGKLEGAAPNRPTNSSLSYTLPHLRSIVELEYDTDMITSDQWAPLTNYKGRQFDALALSEAGAQRFLNHLRQIKEHYGFEGFFRVRSANDFPSDCGLASSASSFAALTQVALVAVCELMHKDLPTIPEAAEWSRRGSGSSCRSFFSPWSVWTSDRVSDVPELAHYGQLLHQVIVVNDEVKSVSSSKAHKRVTSSLLFGGRPERAELRLTDLIDALRNKQWEHAFEIAWAEFWDMHALFESSQPPFGYMTGGSLEVLRFVRDEIWAKEGKGPIVTMDAGPNVHLLYRPEHRALAETVRARFAKQFRVFQALAGEG